jgi:ATP-dependent RNA helicase RhlE
MKFDSLDLAPALLRAVADKGYHTPTPIQAEAIPPILAGRDLVGCAQTGTGKTAAFALPTLHRMLESIARASEARQNPPAPSPSVERAGERGSRAVDHLSLRTTSPPTPLHQGEGSGRISKNSHRNERPKNGRPSSRRKTRTLVLAPTRELCSQIAESFAAYGQATPLRYAVIYGGVGQAPQVRALQHGVDAIIATPGRLLDLMQQGHVDLSHVEILIFDEADQMLDMGFIPDLKRIVARVPRDRQTLMFSATMPDPIRRLAAEWLRDPVAVQAGPVSTPIEKISQSVYFVDKNTKPRLLQQWIENTRSTRTLVFARTKHGADKIVKHLLRGKIFAAAIHGNKSQSQRERALEQFKSSRPPVLVATDIAARGLDIREVSHVVNYDLPMTPETYVHRIGRTGRAGATGAAVSFCSAEDVAQLRSIERLTKRRIDVSHDHAEFTMSPPAVAEERKPARKRARNGAQGGQHGAGKGNSGRPPRRKKARPATAKSGKPRQGAAAGSSTSGDAPKRKPKSRRHTSRL